MAKVTLEFDLDNPTEKDQYEAAVRATDYKRAFRRVTSFLKDQVDNSGYVNTSFTGLAAGIRVIAMEAGLDHDFKLALGEAKHEAL